MVKIKPLQIFLANQKFSNMVLYPLIDSETISKNYLNHLHPRNYIFVDYPQFQTNLKYNKNEYWENSHLNLNILKENEYFIEEDSPSTYLLKQSYNFKFYYSFIVDLNIDEFEKGNLLTSEKCLDEKKNFLAERIENFKHSINPTSFSCKFSDKLKLLIWDIVTNSKSKVRTFIEKESVEVFKLSPEYNDIVIKEIDKMKNLYLLDGHHRLFSFNKFVKNKRKEIKNNPNIKDTLKNNYDHLLCGIIDEDIFEINSFNKLVKSNKNSEEILNLSKDYFEIEKLDFFIKPRNNNEFCIYLENVWYLFKLKDNLINKDISVNNIYVFSLEKYFFDKILNIKDLTKSNWVSYKIGKEANFENLEDSVDNNEYKLAIYNNSIQKNEFKDICQNRILAPPKSFLIFPKPLIGLFTKQIIN